MSKILHIAIPENFDFSSVSGLSNEIVSKFNTFNPPSTLQAASQISGMPPATLDILQIYIKIGAKK